MALAKTTKDHDEIRKWAEARGGKPAVVASTESDKETGILRLMFPNAPNHNDGALEEIGWDEFFEKFDESGLQLTYQEETADHQISDFNKLTYPDPDTAEGKALLRKTASKKGAPKKSAAKKGASVKAAGKTAAKKVAAKKTVPAKKTAAKKVAATKSPAKKSPAKTSPAKKSPAKKTSAKKTASKSASKKSAPATPARNYPRPEGHGPTQVF